MPAAFVATLAVPLKQPRRRRPRRPGTKVMVWRFDGGMANGGVIFMNLQWDVEKMRCGIYGCFQK